MVDQVESSDHFRETKADLQGCRAASELLRHIGDAAAASYSNRSVGNSLLLPLLLRRSRYKDVLY